MSAQAINKTEVKTDDIKSIFVKTGNNVKIGGIEAIFICQNLESLIISKNVTFDKLLNGTFPSGLKIPTSLRNVTIEGGLLEIAENAFANSSIVEFIGPTFAYVGDGCFSNCTSLKTVNLANANLSIASVFEDCTNLTNLTLGDVESLPDENFSYFEELKYVHLENCTNIGARWFANCANLLSVSCGGNFKIGKEAFLNCVSLERPPETAVSIGDFAFANCKALKECNWSIVTSLGANVFENCSMTSLAFGALDKLDLRSLFRCDFEALYINNVKWITNGDNVPLSPSLQHLEALKVEAVPERLMFHYYNLRNVTMGSLRSVPVSLFEYCVQLLDVNMPMVESVGDRAFSHCFSLRAIPAISKVIEVSSYAFESCCVIETIHSESLEEIGAYCFRDCTSLRSVSLPNLITAREGALCEATKLTTLDIPSCLNIPDRFCQSTKSLVCVNMENATRIGKEAFVNSGLCNITVSNTTYIDDRAFYNASSLESFCGEVLETVGDEIFRCCTNLVTVTVPKLLSVGDGAFCGCSTLETFRLPNVHEIGSDCFANCISLINASLPNVTLMWGDCHFMGCTKLSYVSLPNLESVNRGAAKVFEGCKSLQRIDLPNSPPSFHDNVFRNAKDVHDGVVPISLCLRSQYYYASYTGSKKDGQWKGLVEPTNYLEACSGYAEAQGRQVSLGILIGTIIGVLVLVISLIVVIVLVLKWKKKQKQQPQDRTTTELHVELLEEF